jgi:DNA-binding Xre family transcriptional regulator
MIASAKEKLMQEQNIMVRSRLKVLIAERNLELLRQGKPVLTTRRIGEEAGLPQSVVTGLTSGRAVRVDFRTLDRLCNYFKVTPGELLEHVEDDTPAVEAS